MTRSTQTRLEFHHWFLIHAHFLRETKWRRRKELCKRWLTLCTSCLRAIILRLKKWSASWARLSNARTVNIQISFVSWRLAAVCVSGSIQVRPITHVLIACRYTRNLVDDGNGKFNLMLLAWNVGQARSYVHVSLLTRSAPSMTTRARTASWKSWAGMFLKSSTTRLPTWRWVQAQLNEMLPSFPFFDFLVERWKCFIWNDNFRRENTWIWWNCPRTTWMKFCTSLVC